MIIDILKIYLVNSFIFLINKLRFLFFNLSITKILEFNINNNLFSTIDYFIYNQINKLIYVL